MPSGLPDYLKPLQLTRQGARLEGNIGVAEMPRLAKTLVNTDAQVQTSLAFGQQTDGTASVAGKLVTTLAMQCQRCLRRVDIDIDRAFELLLVPEVEVTESLQEADKPEIYELESQRIPTRDFIEDELLLSLPVVSVHSDSSACDPGTARRLEAEFDAQAERQQNNPFAVLKDLK